MKDFKQIEQVQFTDNLRETLLRLPHILPDLMASPLSAFPHTASSTDTPIASMFDSEMSHLKLTNRDQEMSHNISSQDLLNAIQDLSAYDFDNLEPSLSRSSSLTTQETNDSPTMKEAEAHFTLTYDNKYRSIAPLEDKEKDKSVHFQLNFERNEKPFVCKIPGCEKTYKNSNGLKYHMEHHHSALPFEAIFECPVCNEKKYRNLNGLKYHLIHSHPSQDHVSILDQVKAKSL
jgi:hypothetical protein